VKSCQHQRDLITSKINKKEVTPSNGFDEAESDEIDDSVEVDRDQLSSESENDLSIVAQEHTHKKPSEAISLQSSSRDNESTARNHPTLRLADQEGIDDAHFTHSLTVLCDSDATPGKKQSNFHHSTTSSPIGQR
jgi:hypothetical protein